MEIPGQRICLKRALWLYLQQAPLEALLAELKASAAGMGGGAGDRGLPWTSLAFQQRFAAEVVGSLVAEQFPPRLEYVARLTKVLLDEVEAAGEEPAEGLLCARVACVASLRDGTDRDETAFESFFVPPFPRRRDVTPRGAEARTDGGAGATAEGSGGFDEEREAGVGDGVEAEAKAGGFLSFRVANKDNEVGLRIWEAGRALADFCVAHWRLLEGKRVVELGAGIGMTGTAVAVCCGAREVVLTDYAPRVLANLRFNVEVNRRWLLQVGPARNADAARLTVRSLDWTDYASPAPPKATRAPPTPTQTPLTATRAPSATARVPRAAAQVEPPEHRAPEDDGPSEPLPPEIGVGGGEGRSVGLNQGKEEEKGEEEEEEGEGGKRRWRGGGGADEEIDTLGVPEVVLAADVVYDVRYHPALVGVVVETLRRCPDALIVFASTLRNAETMAAFHRCLEEAGVPWHSVNFPGKRSFPPRQQRQQSAEGTTEEDIAAADVPTLPGEGCASSYYRNRGGGGDSGEAFSEEVSNSDVSFEGGGCLQNGVSQRDVSQPGIVPPNGSLQPGIFPPNGILQAGVSQSEVSQPVFLQPGGVLQPGLMGVAPDADAERTTKEDALRSSPPLFSGKRLALTGGAELASLWRSSGSGLWCHPGDLERVRFCVCGRGRGLVC